MSTRPYADLTALGQTRRLRPLARPPTHLNDVDVVGLRLITNGWNGAYRVDTFGGHHVIHITGPIRG